ncbi:hypothetical protein [Bdellovibrio sp. HCB337]|uniref:hypothetical protein n=1 Tax=Bdellovibrio sp. HCB337 TaxID=3394358 RepID=UPI0039A5A66D
MKNSLKYVLAISPLLIIGQKTYAESLEKGNFTVRVNKSDINSIPDYSFEQQVNIVLKYNNIYVDPTSKIQVQENDISLDLNCFNCIIQRVGPEAYEHSPDNKETFVP